MRLRPLLAPWLALIGMASCADLHTLPRDQCGNGIIEAGEDCDGAPVEGHACSAACRLPCSAEGSCPAAWGCGNDGLCRQPSGAFAPFGASLALSADTLALADFDADGRADVLAVRGSTFTVAYLDPGGLQSKTTTVSLTSTDAHRDAPAVGDVNGDQRADLAFHLREGVAVMHGGADRTLVPAAYPAALGSFAEGDALIAVDVDLRPEAAGDEIFAVRADGLYLVHTADPAGPPSGPIVPLPAHGKLAGTPPAAQIVSFYTGTSPNQVQTSGTDLVLAFEGEDHVTVVKPRVQTYLQVDGSITYAWNDGATPAPIVITLPAGAKVRGGAFISGAWTYNSPTQGSQTSSGDVLVDAVDADGHPQMYVAYATGLGFSSKIPFTTPADNQAALMPRVGSDGSPLDASSPLLDAPLVAADLNGDGLVDFITPRGVFVTTCYLAPRCTAPTTTGGAPIGPLQYGLVAQPDGASAWTEALVPGAARKNLGIAGSIYLASGDAGLTYLRGGYGASGQLTAFDAFHIPTPSPLRHLAAGDFDGDGAPDLAFLQASSRAGGVDALHVSFGSPLAIPTPPIDLGDVGALDQIVSTRLAFSSELNDAVSDLVIHAASGGQSALFRFDGSTDRQIQSPLQLTEPCDPTAGGAASLGTPRATAIGRFGGKNLAVAYASSGGLSLYAVDAAAPVQSICSEKSGPAALTEAGDADLAMLPVDLDGDDVDELVILPLGGSRLFVARFAATGITVESLDLGGPHAGLTAADLGARAKGKKAARDVILWSEGGVTVLWNDGSGKLTMAGAGSTSAVVADAKCDGASVGKPNGVAALNVDDDGERELVVVTATRTITLDLDHAALAKGTRSFGAPKCRRDIEGGGAAVQSGDANGDGVPDLVIAGSSGIQVYAGKPVTE